MLKVKALFFLISFFAYSETNSKSNRYPNSEVFDVKLINELKQAQLEFRNENKKESCQIYEKIKSQNDSSIHEYVLLKLWENCPGAKVEFSDFKSYWILPLAEKQLFKKYNLEKKYSDSSNLLISKIDSWQLSAREKEEYILPLLKAQIPKKNRYKILNILEKSSPRFLKKPNPKDFFKVADDLRLNRKFTDARRLYQKIISSPHFSKLEKIKARKWITKTYKLEKFNLLNEFLSSSEKWANFFESEIKKDKPLKLYLKHYHDANIEHVRALWTEKTQKLALEFLEKFEKKIKGKYPLHEIFRLKAKMEQENRNYLESEKWLRLAKNEVFRSDEEKERIYWSLIWILRRLGKFQDSIAVIEELEKESWLTPGAKSKYAFWKAQNLSSLNKESESISQFKKIADQYSYTYYGLLSIRELKRPIPKPNIAINSYKNIRVFFDSEDLYRQFINLVELSETELAKNLIRKKFTSLISSDKASLNLLELFATAGDYLKLYQVFALLPFDEQDEITQNRFHFLFPTPFLSEVKRAESDIGISAAIIYSIMRQESAFDTKARSHADAFGLMQLLPEVAQLTAKKIKWKTIPSAEDLFKPEIIIPLGAAHLKELFSKQQNQFIRAVASYNSTPHAFNGWMKTRFNGNVLEFIEEIPYEETQDYIKLIMRNFIYYKLVLGADKEILFPDELLTITP